MNKSISGLLLCCATLAATLTVSKAQEPMLKDTTESRYKVGQVWSYKTRPGEE